MAKFSPAISILGSGNNPFSCYMQDLMFWYTSYSYQLDNYLGGLSCTLFSLIDNPDILIANLLAFYKFDQTSGYTVNNNKTGTSMGSAYLGTYLI